MNEKRDRKKLTIEIYRDRGGEYRWRARAGNGRIQANCGEGFGARSRSGARRAWRSFWRGDADSYVFENVKE